MLSPERWSRRLQTAADTLFGNGSLAVIIPSTLIYSYTKSCCLKLVNQLSVKPQNVSDCGLNSLPRRTPPSAALLCAGSAGGKFGGRRFPRLIREGLMRPGYPVPQRKGLETPSPARREEPPHRRGGLHVKTHLDGTASSRCPQRAGGWTRGPQRSLQPRPPCGA